MRTKPFPSLYGTKARRRERISSGTDAAANLRKAIKRQGHALCSACGIDYPASALDIDHTIPLYKGGEDIESNVRPLCRLVCHSAKTRRDMGYSKAPF